MAICYVRAADVWQFFIAQGRRDELLSTLIVLKAFDYVSMVNLLLAKVVFCQPGCWDTLVNAGALNGGAEHFRQCGRLLSDRVKKENVDVTPSERVCFYEVASLYGTMCPPVPGWDPTEKTRELAEGGKDQHGLLIHDGTGYTAEDFVEAIHSLPSLPPRDTPEARSFHQWLWDEEWARSGASSLGAIEYTLVAEGETKRGRFKDRKNFPA